MWNKRTIILVPTMRIQTWRPMSFTPRGSTGRSQIGEVHPCFKIAEAIFRPDVNMAATQNCRVAPNDPSSSIPTHSAASSESVPSEGAWSTGGKAEKANRRRPFVSSESCSTRFNQRTEVGDVPGAAEVSVNVNFALGFKAEYDVPGTAEPSATAKVNHKIS